MPTLSFRLTIRAQAGYVVGGRLVPADQNAWFIHGAFHHPAPGFEASLFLDGLSLSPRLRMWAVKQTRPRSGAPISRSPCPSTECSGLGAGRSTGRLSTVHQPYRGGWPRPLNAPGFGPDSPRSYCGVGTGFSPRPGGIWSRPRPCSANSSPNPSNRHSVSATAPGTPRRRPMKAQVGGGAGANARGIQGWQPVVEDAVGAGPVRDPRPPQGMGIHPLGKEWGQRLPQFVGYLEGAGGGVGRRGRAGAGRSMGSFVFFIPRLGSSATFPIHYSCGFHPFLG